MLLPVPLPASPDRAISHAKGEALEDQPLQVGRRRGPGRAFILFVVLSTYYTVDQGQRAVVLHYGVVAGESEPGLHFKYPFIITVQKISIQPQTFNYGSKDQQPTDLRLSVTFHVTNVSKLYALYGTSEGMVATILTPRVYEQMKNVFGQFNAIKAIQNRAVLMVPGGALPFLEMGHK